MALCGTGSYTTPTTLSPSWWMLGEARTGRRHCSYHSRLGLDFFLRSPFLRSLAITEKASDLKQDKEEQIQAPTEKMPRLQAPATQLVSTAASRCTHSS